MAHSDGNPGASARREHERRRRSREQRVRARHPRIGSALLALGDAPQHETSWKTGADGEVRVARALERHLRKHDDVFLFHDRRLAGTRANLDHLAVGPGGITVIDAKHLKGRVQVRRDGGILRPRRERLFVAGRDRSSLVEGLLRQVAAVREAFPAADVRGALCFADVDGLPTLERLSVAGVAVCGAHGAARLARRDGSPDPSVPIMLAREVERAFPPA
jgi:Nuclease-related domain